MTKKYDVKFQVFKQHDPKTGELQLAFLVTGFGKVRTREWDDNADKIARTFV